MELFNEISEITSEYLEKYEDGKEYIFTDEKKDFINNKTIYIFKKINLSRIL